MYITKYEIIGMGVVLALFVGMVITLQLASGFANVAALITDGSSQPASAGTLFVDEDDDQRAALESAIRDSADQNGVRDLIINEVARGTGAAVTEGDTVSVHYVGSLPNGERFDSSHDRGEPFTFTVGAGRVIAGWEQGLLGMREGGTRILVVPPELGYGSQRFGSIPANATLVFAVELLAVE